MKWLQVALFAAVVLAAHAVTQYSGFRSQVAKYGTLMDSSCLSVRSYVTATFSETIRTILLKLELQLVERALCQFSYQCQDNCFCESPRAGVPKFCFCKHRIDDPGVMACRRSMYL